MRFIPHCGLVWSEYACFERGMLLVSYHPSDCSRTRPPSKGLYSDGNGLHQTLNAGFERLLEKKLLLGEVNLASGKSPPAPALVPGSLRCPDETYDLPSQL